MYPYIHSTDIVTKDSDINLVRKLIRKVLINNRAALIDLLKSSLPGLAEELFAADLISSNSLKQPTFDDIISKFMAGMSFKTNLNELQEYLSDFLINLNKLGGSFAIASYILQDEWTEVTKGELKVELHFTH